jgi:hypothetical protein
MPSRSFSREKNFLVLLAVLHKVEMTKKIHLHILRKI